MSSWCSVGVIAKMLVNSTSEDFELDDERFSQMVSEAQIRERKVTRVPKKQHVNRMDGHSILGVHGQIGVTKKC